MDTKQMKAIQTLIKQGVAKEIVMNSYAITADEFLEVMNRKIQKRKLSEDEEATIFRMHKEGKAVKEIAQFLDISRESVSKRLRKMTEYSKKRKLSEEEKQAVIKAFNGGCKAKFIADMFGITVTTVYTITEGHRMFFLKQSRRMTKEEQAQAMELYENGVSVTEIAKKLSVNTSSIYRLMKRWKK